MGMVRFLGAHCSVAGGMPNAIARATSLGCTAAQVFVKNASQWQGRELTAEEAVAFRAAHAASAVGPLVAHASYLINLCSADPALLARSREALADELRRCARLGVGGLVVHPGAHLGAGEEAGAERGAASLDAVLGKPPGAPARARAGEAARRARAGAAGEHRRPGLLPGAPPGAPGGGPRPGGRARAGGGLPGHLPRLRVRPRRASGAGCALGEPAGYEEMWAELAARIGFAALGCMHLNDSLRPFGSR